MNNIGSSIGRPDSLGVPLFAAIVILLAVIVILAAANLATIALVLGPALLVVPLLVLRSVSISSRILILVVLAGAVFLLEAVFRVRAYDAKDIDFQILIKVASWLALIAIAFTNLGQTIRVITSTACLPWSLLFLYLLLTSVWAPNPLHSAVAAVSVISFFVFFASLTGRIETEDILLAILAGIALLSLASLAIYFINPSFGRMHGWSGAQQTLTSRLSGLAGHPNTIGRLCCFGILVAVNQWRNLRQLWRPAPYLVLGLLGVTLLLSNSRTSIGIVAVLLLAYAFVRARYLPYLLLLVATGMLAFLVLGPYAEQVMQMLSRSGNADEIATGTNRTHIWAVVKMLIWQKPLLGWGYGSSVFIMPQYERLMGHAAPHAHNIFLQLWLTTGMTGLVLFLLSLCSRLAVAIRQQEGFQIILLLFVVLNGLSESSAFGGVANITTVALCLAATSFRRVDAVHSRQAMPQHGAAAA